MMKIAESGKVKRCFILYCACCLLAAVFWCAYPGLWAEAAEPVRLEFFYENVCASCEGDADFYALLDRCITAKEREDLQAEIVTYNVFYDSCGDYYEETAGRLGIPEGTALPVLIIGDQWMSGYEQMEESLYAVLLGQSLAVSKEDGMRTEGTQEPLDNTGGADGDTDEPAREQAELEALVGQLAGSGQRKLLLFTTTACEDCEQVKEWLSRQRDSFDGEILEYNIIEDPCLNILKGMFLEYGTAEEDQKVPALFGGGEVRTGKEAITALDLERFSGEQGNESLVKHLGNVKEWLAENPDGSKAEGLNLITLAGAGLLAGLNPCSISMLLMLLSLVAGERASVLKNGLLYLAGKYITYFAIGMAVYVCATQVGEEILSGASRGLGILMALLFLIAGGVYLADAVRILRKDYGKIRTQLPVGLRRWNHRIIHRVSGYSGVLKPLLILGLGMAVSLGEFFCTGQIYMASISYLLRERAHGVWLPFLVYVSAMSVPAFLMIVLIQRTRNAECVSEFMLRHLGAIKILNAALFLGFAGYFLFN